MTLFSGIIRSPSVSVTPIFFVTFSAGKISRWSFKGRSPYPHEKRGRVGPNRAVIRAFNSSHHYSAAAAPMACSTTARAGDSLLYFKISLSTPAPTVAAKSAIFLHPLRLRKSE